MWRNLTATNIVRLPLTGDARVTLEELSEALAGYSSGFDLPNEN